MTSTMADGVIVSKSYYDTSSYWKKNRRQGQSLAPAAFLLIGNGIVYGSVLFTLPLKIIQVYMTMFFVGTLIGVIAASFLLHKLKKSIHYFLAGIFTLLSGILYLTIETEVYMVKVPDGYIAAIFFSGLSFGIVLLTAIIHSSGICVKHLRGLIINLQLQDGIDWGILIYLFIFKKYYDSLVNHVNSKSNVFEPIGITLIVFSILSFITILLFCIESPEFLYETNNDSDALVSLKLLRKENLDTLEILNELAEIRNSVHTNVSSVMLFENIISFIKIFSLRFAYILGTSIPLNIRFMVLLQLYIGYDYMFVNGIIFMLARILGEIFGNVSIVMLKGYKKTLMISLFLSGLLLIIINSIYISSYQDEIIKENSTINCLGILILIYQIAIGYGSGGISLLAMAEGFSFNLKTYLNAILIGIECLIQIIIICSIDIDITDSSFNAYIFIAGFVQLIVCGIVFIFIPETYHKSLNETNKLYSKLINVN